MKKALRVTAGVVIRHGLVLIARRKPGKHQEGMWEFPGGKIEPGETPEEALRRELAEEFGVDTQVGDFIASARHVYHEELTVELLAYRVRHVSGEFRPQDHDALAWVAPEELPRYALCPADLFILEHL